MKWQRWTLYSAVASASLLGACKKNAPVETPAAAPATPVATAAKPASPSVQDRIASVIDDVKKAPQLAQVGAALDKADEIRAAVLNPWSKAWAAKDTAAFQKVLAPNASVPAFAGSDRTVKREMDGIREYNWALKPATAADDTAKYLAGFSKVESVSLEIASFDPAETTATVGLHFDVRGVVGESTRRNDRGLVNAEVIKTAEGWKLSKLTPVSVESLETAPNRKPAFADATTSLGLDKLAVTDRKEAIRRGGYALATGDFDGDGKADILVGNYGPMKLYRNTGSGFEDVTATSGLRGETLVKAAAMADLDNDGKKDIVLVRFIDTSKVQASKDQAGDLLIGDLGQTDMIAYKNLGNGKFEYKGDVLLRKHHYDRSMPMALADFNGDGTLDIYIGFPGARDFTNDLNKDSKEAYNLGLTKQGLWLNDGKWGFKESQGWTASNDPDTMHPYPHSALVADLNNDGKAELIVVDDSGAASPVYQLDRDGKFHDVTAQMGLKVPGWSMTADAADYDGDGLNDLVLTKVALAEQEWGPALMAKADANYKANNFERDQKRFQSVHLFHNKGDGHFEEVSGKAGIAWAGHGLAGANWVDYNNDGQLDLYLANGLWSGGEEDAGSLFSKLQITRDGRPAGTTDAAMTLPGEQTNTPNPMLSILREFKGTLANPKGAAVSDKPTLSLGGNQRNRLFRNNGDGTFTEVAFLENADRAEDGYVTAVADYDNDGHPDLVLRNCDPAPGRMFHTLIALHNQLNSAPAVAVTLSGTRDNANAIGAQLTGWVGGKKYYREIHGVAGTVQSDTVAFFGLGHSKQVDKLEVRWPSGRVEEFGPLAAGNVTLKEGTGREIHAANDVKLSAVPE